ncbi:MAG TPA: hypothetical protein VHK28_06245 [Candidatus Limnocylindria bacterium]|nr:hypothetical protein [Candidatus Limnocylindria bacterium]
MTACGDGELATLVDREGLSGAAVLRLDEGYAVAARARGGGAEVIAFLRDEDAGWQVQRLAHAGSSDDELVQLISYGGETGEVWNTFVYGLAGPDVSRVVLEGRPGPGGQVIDGAWVIALQQKDLAPADIRWRFLSASGGTLRTGSGITP